MATSEAQKRAVKKYNENHKEQHYYYDLKAKTKNFIKSKATLDDLHELLDLIKDKLNEF